MHDYSIDKHPKEIVLFLLAFCAIWSAPKLNQLGLYVVEKLDVWTGLSWPLITAIPVFALFTMIYFVFNKYLWRLGALRGLLLVPDLNGRWKCSGKTVLKAGQSADYRWAGDIQITQSWSKVLIHLKTGQSSSRSFAASIHHDPGVGYRLAYQYSNDPGADQLELNKHSGSAEITFDEDCTRGEGWYFTDQHRSTVGTLILERA